MMLLTTTAQITPEQLVECDADIIVIAPCGFDMARAHKDALQLWQHDWWKQLRAVQEGKVFALDGNAYYARYAIITLLC
jgi:iron complex transport system substrate-binding protein